MAIKNPAEIAVNIGEKKVLMVQTSGTSIIWSKKNDVKHTNGIEKYLVEKHGTALDIKTGFQTSTERVMTKRNIGRKISVDHIFGC